MFKTGSERLIELNARRLRMPKPIHYGVPFLDDVTGGIYPDCFVIVTAKTGFGKTELLSSVVQNAAQAGKKVHMFALEAFRGEIEARIKFKALANAFYLAVPKAERTRTPNYQDWMQGRQDAMLARFEPEVDEELMKFFGNFKTFYTEESFDADTFESHMHRIGGETDLVILDHLHYMDLEGKNENVEFKKTVKQMKNVVTFHGKPVIMAAQLRKSGTDFKNQTLLPETDDIHGSSDIGKIVTHILGVAPADDQEGFRKNVFPTYFKLLKNRFDMSRTRFVGLCGYDIASNQYSKNYQLGKLSKSKTEFKVLEKEDYPQWADHIRPQIQLQTSFTLNGDATDNA